jgi:epoxyqueuosine reductase
VRQPDDWPVYAAYVADLTSELRGLLTDRGAAAVGVCTADPFDDTRGAVQRSVRLGYSAGMRFTFADPKRSTDVRTSLPWARSMLVCAFPYPLDTPVTTDGEGRVARFAVSDNYAPMRAALAEAAACLKEHGWNAEVLVDDNRLVDRAAAARSGVGWWGKNTMVLVPGHGPWTLLGSVVTDADLDVTTSMLRTCGTCIACLPACPTDALVAPGILDARRCLAAIAQSSGPIPLEFRAAMGDRIYGCDDCLEACPPGGRALRRAGTSRIGVVEVVDLLRAADRTLLERFTHFYIPKRNPRYLRRNALVALGNCGDRRVEGILAGYLGHPDSLLRRHAAWALGHLAVGRRALIAAAGRERERGVQGELRLALAAAEGAEQVP